MSLSLPSRRPASWASPFNVTLPSQGRACPGHHPHGPPEEDPGQHPDHEGPADQHPGAPPAPLTKPSQLQVVPAVRGPAGLAGSQGRRRLPPPPPWLPSCQVPVRPGALLQDLELSGVRPPGKGPLVPSSARHLPPGQRAFSLPEAEDSNATEPNRDVALLPPRVCVHTCSCDVWSMFSQGHGTTCVCLPPGPSMNVCRSWCPCSLRLGAHVHNCGWHVMNED